MSNMVTQKSLTAALKFKATSICLQHSSSPLLVRIQDARSRNIQKRYVILIL